MVTSEAVLPEGVVFLQFDNKLILNKALSHAQKDAIIDKLDTIGKGV